MVPSSEGTTGTVWLGGKMDKNKAAIFAHCNLKENKEKFCNILGRGWKEKVNMLHQTGAETRIAYCGLKKLNGA